MMVAAQDNGFRTFDSCILARPTVVIDYKTNKGVMFHGSAETVLASSFARRYRGKVQLLFTSPPYLLSRYGPSSTERLHTLIEPTHPDLCNNDVDRVIDGKRYGKKWKHAVRTAQQNLKKKGLITLLDNGYWTLTDKTTGLRGII